MAGASGTIAYIGVVCLLILGAFLTLLVLISNSFKNSNYQELITNEESKQKLDYGNNLALGGILLSSFLIAIFLIITIIAIIYSIRQKSEAGVFGNISTGLKQTVSGVGEFFNPVSSGYSSGPYYGGGYRSY
jgi:ABC-type Fe3+ transport system permease subunit